MNYLKRNQSLITEIGQEIRLQKGKIVGTNPRETTTVTSLGQYHSGILVETVYVGLKESDIPGENDRVSSELSVIRGVERYAPELLPEFPVFYGLLSDKYGKSIGILTEDFSKGGQYKVEDMTLSWGMRFKEGTLPKQLEKVVGHPIDEYDLATVYFLVNGQRRIGDFGEICMAITSQDWIERFAYPDILRDMDKYTLRVDHAL